MKFSLKEFQQDAVSAMLDCMRKMRGMYEDYDQLSAVSLTAPTGSGKTVMATAIVESLFFGNVDFGYDPDPKASVLWLSDSPSLNEQTLNRFVQASEKLASSILDQRHLEIVDNTFCASHEMLDPGHVYFLSKDLLGKGKLLVKGGEENNGRVFWDLLDRTINDPDRHLYLFIDEAHRGLGTNGSDGNAQTTIYANLIDGYAGRAPMPIVVGISATPKRFENAMLQRKNRNLQPAVQVSPKEVQESGLLKDVIELRVPENDDSVEHQYLDMACDRLLQSENAWDAYCDKQHLPPVEPLMVVQVADRIGAEGLKNICDQICRKLPHLDRKTVFANVFGEHTDLAPSPALFIPYVQPEHVQQRKSIRVLFAKEAISNGWDCPRAEVIFSQRRRSDDTYIAQLIGRMVRTPLGRRIDSDDTLNSVACYLPLFNPDATQSVIDYLTGKTNEIGGTYVQNVITNPVTIEWGASAYYDETDADSPDTETFDDYGLFEAQTDQFFESTVADDSNNGSHSSPSADRTVQETEVTNVTVSEEASEGAGVTPIVPEHVSPRPRPKKVIPFTKEEWQGIEAAYGTLRRRVNTKKARNEFRSLLDTATLMMDTKLDPHAGEQVNKDFCNRLEGQIVEHEDDFAVQKHNVEVAEMQVITIDKLNDNRVTAHSEAPRSDAEGVADAAKEADRRFGGKEFVNAYKRKMLKGQKMPLVDINLRLAAAVRTASIMSGMEEWAIKERTQYFDDHAADRDYLSEADRQEYDRLMQETRGVRDVKLAQPTRSDVDGNYTRYPKHVVYDLRDGLCPLSLNQVERYVVSKELSRDRTVAFYRNPSNFSQKVFSFPYTMPSGRMALHPDFIFFVRTADGEIKPSIIDPHGDYLGDTLPKLKGYIEYLRDYPTMFAQVLSVTPIAGGKELRFLNLLDQTTQSAITEFSGDHAETLYTGKYSNKYGEIGDVQLVGVDA